MSSRSVTSYSPCSVQRNQRCLLQDFPHVRSLLVSFARSGTRRASLPHSWACWISPAFCRGGCCQACCQFPCPRCMGWCWALLLKVFLVLTPVLTELCWKVLNYARNRVRGVLFSTRSFKKTSLCWAVPAAVRSQVGHVQQLDSEIVS